MILNGLQEIFAQNIAKGINKTEAAMLAGYSKSTARNKASNLLRDSAVIARIDELKADIAKGGKGVAITEEVGDPKAFLTSAMLNDDLPARLRIEAAKVLMPYKYRKLGEGKKEAAREKAEIKAKASGLSARMEKAGFLKKVK